MHNIKVFVIVIFLSLIFFNTNGLSQELFPNRPIVLVEWSSGGMGDNVTRVLCSAAEKELGKPFIIDHRPGAGGALAVNYVLKSKPDGYTIGRTTTGIHWILPHMRKMPYDPLTELTDIMAFCKYNFGLCVRADAPWNTYEDVLEYARKNPGKFTYACAGVGVTQHICMERIAMKEGIKWTMVPFKSGAESTMAVLGAHTDAVVQGSVDVTSYIKTGKLKMLLVLNDSRWPDFSNVPHILEKGYNFSAVSYLSFYGPKGMPEPLRQKLEDVLKNAMKAPSFMEMVDKFKLEASFVSGREFSVVWRSGYDEMGKVIKAMGLSEK
ncbi:MAG: tripartite tricarboxylate transporter substrate binding protein [Deltaproteobacteria bacterium]